MKDLKQIQEDNRKAIICTVHGTDDYEEALKRELESDNIDCVVLIEQKNIPFLITKVVFHTLSDSNFLAVGGDKYKTKSIKKILGKPLTLDRVLLALNCVLYDAYISEECYYSGDKGGYFRFDIKPNDSLITICWNLTKQTLEEQTEETQRAIWELLNK